MGGIGKSVVAPCDDLAVRAAFPDDSHDDRLEASAGAFNAAAELDAAGGASAVNEPEEEVDVLDTKGW